MQATDAGNYHPHGPKTARELIFKLEQSSGAGHMGNDREELNVVLHFSDDARNLIAAGKIQRWEVVKWSVTVNVALAATSGASGKGQFLIFCVAVAITVFGLVLLFHYNSRMTKNRTTLRNLYKHFQDTVTDINKIAGATYDRHKNTAYDSQELWIFCIAIGLSVLPALAAWLL